MNRPTLISLNIGKPETLPVEGHRGQMRSGIHKQPVPGKVYLGLLGFAGDGVANKRVHGGPDKAVCAYCVDHFPHWEERYGREVSPGAFGENLSIQGLPETQVHIGDVFQVGEARLQCSQPRQPCNTLSRFWNQPDLVRQVQETGFSGYYFRVLTPGWVETGMTVDLIESGPDRFSVQAANRLMYKTPSDVEKLRQILSIEPLSESWKETFRTRLKKIA